MTGFAGSSMDSGRLFFDPSSTVKFAGDMLFIGNGDHVYRGQRTVINMEETLKRRPFFSSSDEMFDEEYYDDQSPEKKRRLTPEQVQLLEKSFETENKLEPERKTQLAKSLGLQPRQVAVWFQNRRARWKTKQLERDFDHLKASYDSLLFDFDSIRKDNDKLKAEVASLTEKLQDKEVAGEPISGPESDPLPTDEANASIFQLNVKIEDRLSTGSGGSAVVDEDGRQLVDSGDSFFPTGNNYHHLGSISPADGIPSSEEDDGSDDGRNYFSDAFAPAEEHHHHHHHQEEGEAIGWWVWS